MVKRLLLLTGLDGIREALNPWVVFILSLLALIAFFPKLKNSIVGRLTRENIRLRGMVADMTLEEEVKNVLILANKKQIEELQAAIVDLHRTQFEQIHHSPDAPKGTGR